MTSDHHLDGSRIAGTNSCLDLSNDLQTWVLARDLEYPALDFDTTLTTK